MSILLMTCSIRHFTRISRMSTINQACNQKKRWDRICNRKNGGQDHDRLAKRANVESTFQVEVTARLEANDSCKATWRCIPMYKNQGWQLYMYIIKYIIFN